jgi:hypothetical protein
MIIATGTDFLILTENTGNGATVNDALPYALGEITSTKSIEITNFIFDVQCNSTATPLFKLICSFFRNSTKTFQRDPEFIMNAPYKPEHFNDIFKGMVLEHPGDVNNLIKFEVQKLTATGDPYSASLTVTYRELPY